jgi:hypothetical protein
MSEAKVLRRHRLSHIPELKVNENIFRIRYKAGCSMMKCSGYCCRDGVVAELHERDRILENVPLVQRLMDETQPQDPATWFDEEFADPDAIVGRSTGTMVHGGKCVFLNKKSRCVLQTAAEEGVPGLKPFYCFAYPICVTDGELVIDDVHCPSESACCGPVGKGELTILDLCGFELEFVLGKEGFAELREMFDRVSSGETEPA